MKNQCIQLLSLTLEAIKKKSIPLTKEDHQIIKKATRKPPFFTNKKVKIIWELLEQFIELSEYTYFQEQIYEKTKIAQQRYYLSRAGAGIRRILEIRLKKVDKNGSSNKKPKYNKENQKIIELITQLLAYLPKKESTSLHGECKQLIIIDNKYALIFCDKKWYKVPLENI